MNSRTAPPPQGLYVPAKRHGDLIFVLGMTPRKNGELLHVGQVALDAPDETYRAAVELAAENALQAAGAQLAAGEKIASALSLTVRLRLMRATPTLPTSPRGASKVRLEKGALQAGRRLVSPLCPGAP
jgi:enamine deaminase RidA (YjgF/YER057c/UK114 family)